MSRQHNPRYLCGYKNDSFSSPAPSSFVEDSGWRESNMVTRNDDYLSLSPVIGPPHSPDHYDSSPDCSAEYKQLRKQMTNPGDSDAAPKSSAEIKNNGKSCENSNSNTTDTQDAGSSEDIPQPLPSKLVPYSRKASRHEDEDDVEKESPKAPIRKEGMKPPRKPGKTLPSEEDGPEIDDSIPQQPQQRFLRTDSVTTMGTAKTEDLTLQSSTISDLRSQSHQSSIQSLREKVEELRLRTEITRLEARHSEAGAKKLTAQVLRMKAEKKVEAARKRRNEASESSGPPGTVATDVSPDWDSPGDADSMIL